MPWEFSWGVPGEYSRGPQRGGAESREVAEPRQGQREGPSPAVGHKPNAAREGPTWPPRLQDRRARASARLAGAHAETRAPACERRTRRCAQALRPCARRARSRKRAEEPRRHAECRRPGDRGGSARQPSHEARARLRDRALSPRGTQMKTVKRSELRCSNACNRARLRAKL